MTNFNLSNCRIATRFVILSDPAPSRRGVEGSSHYRYCCALCQCEDPSTTLRFGRDDWCGGEFKTDPQTQIYRWADVTGHAQGYNESQRLKSELSAATRRLDFWCGGGIIKTEIY